MNYYTSLFPLCATLKEVMVGCFLSRKSVTQAVRGKKQRYPLLFSMVLLEVLAYADKQRKEVKSMDWKSI
jgi:hypothetical protein